MQCKVTLNGVFTLIQSYLLKEYYSVELQQHFDCLKQQRIQQQLLHELESNLLELLAHQDVFHPQVIECTTRIRECNKVLIDLHTDIPKLDIDVEALAKVYIQLNQLKQINSLYGITLMDYVNYILQFSKNTHDSTSILRLIYANISDCVFIEHQSQLQLCFNLPQPPLPLIKEGLVIVQKGSYFTVPGYQIILLNEFESSKKEKLIIKQCHLDPELALNLYKQHKNCIYEFEMTNYPLGTCHFISKPTSWPLILQSLSHQIGLTSSTDAYIILSMAILYYRSLYAPLTQLEQVEWHYSDIQFIKLNTTEQSTKDDIHYLIMTLVESKLQNELDILILDKIMLKMMSIATLDIMKVPESIAQVPHITIPDLAIESSGSTTVTMPIMKEDDLMQSWLKYKLDKTKLNKWLDMITMHKNNKLSLLVLDVGMLEVYKLINKGQCLCLTDEKPKDYKMISLTLIGGELNKGILQMSDIIKEKQYYVYVELKNEFTHYISVMDKNEMVYQLFVKKSTIQSHRVYVQVN